MQWFALVALILMPSAPAPAQSRPETSAASFEVASIVPQPWTNEGRVAVSVRGNTLTGEHVDLYRLIEFAYGLRNDDSQLSGGPAWARHGVLSATSGADSVLFHVIAKAAEGSSPSVQQFRFMLQRLLADRCHLQVHKVRKYLPVFYLTVARRGPKFKENTSGIEPAAAFNDGRVFRMRAVHVPMANPVSELSDSNHGAGRPVLDKTGLTGFYDFEIEWSPHDLAAAQPGDPTADPAGPSVFTAVEIQLGLRLEPGAAPFDAVVIDHAEKPSRN